MGRADRISASLAHAFAPLVDLIFPPRCPLCGEATAAQGGLCSSCWGLLVIPGEPACASCSRPIPSLSYGATCAPCLADPPRHAGIAAATIYNAASRKLLLSFKHGHRIALAPQLARLMAAKLPQAEGQLPLLVPVPLHRWRLWRRGFNQSALLARELARHGKGELLVDVLVRKKSTPMLGGMTRSARQRTLSGAIALNPSRKRVIEGREIILVDDVLTSGATSGACVALLLKAGASSVRISCFARVLDEALHGDTAAFESGAGPENITPGVG